MDRSAGTEGGGFSVPEPGVYVAASVDAAICPAGCTAGSPRLASTIPHTGTRTMRRTKASLIYRRTKNLGTVQLLLKHTRLESTVRYLGIEVDDVLEIAEQTEV